MKDALGRHWPEYLMEAAGLGLFMMSAGGFAIVLYHPASPVAQVLVQPVLRRLLMGCAMGLTAAGLIYSPWGKQSGAHINPAVTLTFFRLGKVEPWDALFYVVAQFAGGLVGVVLVALALGHSFADPPVNHVATLPGPGGLVIAFVAEVVISFVLMLVVLVTTNVEALGRYTGVFAGVLVATYIVVEAPVSGMSMNPARTLGSALPAQLWESLWIYFTAPPLGMLLAAETYLRSIGPRGAICAKLHHYNDKRCIFRCGYSASEVAHHPWRGRRT